MLLQIWAGMFYLLNKIFFSRAERSQDAKKRRWKIWSWVVYLIGLPAWLVVFSQKPNWIAFGVEAGGAPAMVLGLVIALRGKDKEPKWLKIFALIGALVGLWYSVKVFHGVTTINQVLEFGIAIGFLAGTYLLAKENSKGYLWFLLMNASNAALMGIQGYPWLALQQIISYTFVLDAYVIEKKNRKSTKLDGSVNVKKS